jgi:hypothetical protein
MKRSIYILFLFTLLFTTGWSQITQMEYYIDTDPGQGTATPITIAAGDSVLVTMQLDFEGVSEGFHVLGLRSYAVNQGWGITKVQNIYKSNFVADDSLVAVEYFIDNDPGFGLGSAVDIEGGKHVQAVFLPDISLLSVGFHSLGIRSKSKSGKWSVTKMHTIVVSDFVAEDSIEHLEYFIDNDPGIGHATRLTVVPNKVISLVFDVELSALEAGFHTLVYRVQSSSGEWSLAKSQAIMVSRFEAEDTIVRLEYFIDADPGIGVATTIPIIPQEVVNSIVTLDLSVLDNGFHTMVYRVLSKRGVWSVAKAQTIVVNDFIGQDSIVDMEYFIDNDPGFGLGVGVSISADTSVRVSFSPDLSTLSMGFHAIGMRTKSASGLWGSTFVRSFVKHMLVTDTLIDAVEYFIDVDPGVGLATSISNADVGAFSQTLMLDVLSLTDTTHTLYVRAKTTLGVWGFVASKDFIKGIPTSLASLENRGVYFYPNPSSQQITIVGVEGEVLRIYSVDGVLLQEKKLLLPMEEMDISGFDAGLYFLNVNGKIAKLLKE